MKVDQTKKLVAKEKLLDILAARYCALAFLKRAFLEEPTKEYLELLTEGDVLAYFPEVGDDALLKSGYEALSFYLRDPGLLTKDSVKKLGAEYLSLFIGPEKLGAAPYESVYRSARPLVFQEHTMEVRAEYAKHGLIPERFQQEPDDHISLELDFMLRLVEKTMADIRAKRYSKARKLMQAQKSFMTDHVMKWVPAFSAKVIESAKTDFYRGIGKMLIGYLKMDQALIDGLVKELDARAKQERAKRLVSV